MPDVSIVIRATDRFSDAMRTMSNSGRAFDRDIAGMQRHLDALNNTRAILRVDTDRARQELRRAQQQYRELGDAASEAELRTRNATFENARRNLDLVRREAAEVERQMIRTSRSMSEADNQAGNGQRNGRFSSIRSFSYNLAQAGVLNEFSPSVSEVFNTGVSSALGQPTASAVSSIAGGIISGAAAGSLLGPQGALIGAGAGAVSGALSGASKIFQAKDDAFKSYVQEAFDEQIDAQEASRAAGSTIAGTREQTQMAFTQKLGSDAAADDYLAQVKTMAKNTNYGYDEITGYSKLLLNTYDTTKTLDVLQKLSDASAGLNLNSSDVNMFIAGLSRMRTTGKATQEYLNYFSERGVDVYQALSDSTGADKSSISGMITHGEISGDHAAESILTYIDNTYGGLSEKLASTYDAMVDNLADYQADMDAAMGEGYNEGRKAGIQAQMDWMSGESGAAVEEANKAIGAWKAELENQKEEFIRNAMDTMMSSDEYQTAKAAGDAAEMGRLMMQAKVQGMNEYNASEGATEALNAEMALADAIRNDASTNDSYWNAGYEKGNWFSKGLAASIGSASAKWSGSSGGPIVATGRTFHYGGKPHAAGIDRVPYDNYPALLHEGERVQTAVEARSSDGNSQPIVISGNNFNIREDADVDRVASALLQKMELAALRW